MAESDNTSGKQGADDDSLLSDSSVLEGGWEDETARAPQARPPTPPKIPLPKPASSAAAPQPPQAPQPAKVAPPPGIFSPPASVPPPPNAPPGRGSPVAPPPIRRPTASPGGPSAIAVPAPGAPPPPAAPPLPSKPVGPPPLRNPSSSTLAAVTPPATKEVTNTSLGAPTGLGAAAQAPSGVVDRLSLPKDPTIVDEAPPPREPLTLGAEIQARAERLARPDPVGSARALVELGIYEERLNHDRKAARAWYQAARTRVRALEPALLRMRRLLGAKAEAAQVLSILEEEISAATSDAARADLLAERARACDALGKSADSRGSYAEALRIAPLHAASLRGLEAVLRRDVAKSSHKTLFADLATHLERLSAAYAPGAEAADGDPALTAWIHVERALVLDRKLGQQEQALASLMRATSFAPGPGPVRDALTRHLVLHDNLKDLINSLRIEADQEQDHDRASRLLYMAGRLLVDKFDMPASAVDVFSAASARAPGTTPTAQRILAELIRLLEKTGAPEVAATVRQQRLALLVDVDAVVNEHMRLSEIYDALGKADLAAVHAGRALEMDPDAPGTRERLDRALQRLGRHDERVRAWAAIADAKRPVAARVAALMRAAEIAERNLRRPDEAIAYLRAAWAIDPGNTQIFDALSVLLSPHVKDPESDPRGVRARIDLYTQAAETATDPHRRIGLLEKLVAIWEDELSQPARAIEEIEKVLAIDPQRRTAILALQRCAARAGDAARLARALKDEADLTPDRALQKRLLLQAAEVMSARMNDRDRALALVDRALEVDPIDEAALRARQRIDERAGKHEEARRSLVRLIGRDPSGEAAFGLWIEVAAIDELRLKRPRDAVEAFRQAAKLRVNHPLPRLEIARILRDIGDHGKLVEALMGLAGKATEATDYARLLFQAAEVQEISIGNDEAALQSLAQADAHLAEGSQDPAILEVMERIYVRKSASRELAALYTRWLERMPPPAVDHAIRIALAGVLSDSDKEQAIELLSGLRSVVPGHVPAIRMLEQLHRATGAHAALASTLRAEADVFTSRLARTGALWELVALEEELGSSATLEALDRLVADAPTDVAALDAMARVAGKLSEGLGAHPTVLAVRAKLMAAIRARKELTPDPISRAMLQIEEAILLEARIPEEASSARFARDAYREALSLWPDSVLAARGLDRMAQTLGDRGSAITANIALAKLMDDGRERAGHLVRAAELTAEDGNREPQARALELYEQALAAYPDCAPAAQSIARMLAGDPGRLIDRLTDALGRATVRAQVILLGTEIGHATLRHKDASTVAPDPGVGVSAMRRVLSASPDDVPSLLLMARLLSAQRVWAEARDMLQHAVTVASDNEALMAAQFMLADLYEGPLADLDRAEACLQTILSIDGGSRRALEKLYVVATARNDGVLGIQVLGRLVEIAADAPSRVEADLRLAEACRKEGDSSGMVRALCDAMASAPSDLRAGSMLARLYRIDTTDGAASYVKGLQQALDIANARRLPIDPRWLMTMGLLEATVLMRPREGITHLQQAVVIPGAPADARAALGRGLEAANRNSEAVTVLRDVFTSEPDTIARIVELAPALAALDAALAKEGRIEERLVVEEARACLAEVKADRTAWLRARRLPAEAPHMGSLAGAELARLLVPEARSPMIDVSVALAPVVAKALRFEIASLGVTSRERIGPRDGHPTRMLADRIARALGIESFELYLTPTWKGAARVYPGDPPAIVASTSIIELPEPEQMFGLARLLTRAALGFAWLDELTIEAADGLLLAALRSVVPTFGSNEISGPREHALQGFLVPVQKAIGRRQRKLLEEIAPAATPAYDARTLTIGVRRSEYRVAYILSGDLLCAIDYLRRYDREIARSAEDPRVLLQHPVTNELIRYALSAEGYAERRRVGTG